MSTDITIEAVNLADLDWTPQCDVLHGHKGEQTRCERPAVYVIEVTHCICYRLFSCRPCATNDAPWSCRVCDADLAMPPVVIGEAS